MRPRDRAFGDSIELQLRHEKRGLDGRAKIGAPEEDIVDAGQRRR